MHAATRLDIRWLVLVFEVGEPFVRVAEPPVTSGNSGSGSVDTMGSSWVSSAYVNGCKGGCF